MNATVIVLVALLVTAGIWVSAQRDVLTLEAPTVIAGSDLGFRVESTKNNIAVGKIVIRVNGRWVEAQIGTTGVVPAGVR
jgi:hypothetical protein